MRIGYAPAETSHRSAGGRASRGAASGGSRCAAPLSPPPPAAACCCARVWLAVVQGSPGSGGATSTGHHTRRVSAIHISAWLSSPAPVPEKQSLGFGVLVEVLRGTKSGAWPLSPAQAPEEDNSESVWSNHEQ